jgi:hypothetical protein
VAVAAAILACACMLVSPAVAPGNGSALKLLAKPAGTAGEVDVRVRAPGGRTVRIAERIGRSWYEVLSARTDRRGRLHRSASLTATSGAVSLRATTRGARPRVVSVDLGTPAAPAPTPTPAPAPAPEAEPDPPPADMPVGFNNNAVSQRIVTAEQSAALLADAGADVDRVQIAWERLERTPGSYDFAVWDSVYAADLARGIRPLFILAYAPRWASGADACAGVTGRCLASPRPEYYDDFARAAAAVAARYPRAAGIEIWNEPNHQHFWRPASDPEAYAALLRESHAAVKQVDPSMPVAGVSLAQRNTHPGSVAPTEFLQRVYAAGAGGSMDALSVHAYAGDDATAQRAVDDVTAARAVRDAAGASSTPLWLTETGASSTGPGALSEVDQAARILLLERRLRATPGVEMLLVHTLVEPPLGPESRETGYGIVRADLSLKPVYCGLALAWGGTASC